MTLFSGVKRFLLQNFWRPAQGKAADYNIFNTSIYAALFALGAAYIGYPLLKKLDISLDREFFLSITPYILLGSVLRVLEDLKIVDSFLMVTPFIYFWMFGFTAAVLAASRYAYGDDYHRVFGSLGLVLLVPTLLLYNVSTFVPLLQAFAIFAAVSGLFYLVVKKFRPELAVYSFLIPVIAHYWDASTSFIALSYGAYEKHVLAQFFVNSLGPAGMFVMKTLIIVPATYYIMEDVEGERKRYYLFLVALLGIALGTRNIISLITV